jgi:hypothetical protein
MTMKTHVRAALFAGAFSASGLMLGAGVAAAQDDSNAFQITQATGANYVPATAWVACGGGDSCKTVLEPPKVVSLGPGNLTNTATLTSDLNNQRGGFGIAKYGGNLNINFVVTDYEALNNGTRGGADFVVDFTNNNPRAPLPANLHWIQIVQDNWNITGVDGGDLSAPMGLGNHENVVDAPKTPNNAYYDVSSNTPPNPFNTTPPHFEDGSGRGEPTRKNPVITWNAELWLVSDPKNDGQFTIYNGVEWGWATYLAVPEPATWMMIIMGGGLIGVALRRRPLAATRAA